MNKPVKEYPLLFNTEMVRAILDDRKTMTRRVMKIQPEIAKYGDGTPIENHADGQISDQYHVLKSKNGVIPLTEGCSFRWLELCPFGRVGDRLWVRETWAMAYVHELPKNHPHKICGTWGVPAYPEFESCVVYKADGVFDKKIDQKRRYGNDDRTKPFFISPMSLQREYSRITLEITEIRLERLNDISEEDAKAEGCDNSKSEAAIQVGWFEKPVTAFKRLWQSVYGEESWTSNPWVWCISFKRVDQ